jgi:TRAP-type uncharacterized transport system fused permease subunit
MNKLYDFIKKNGFSLTFKIVLLLVIGCFFNYMIGQLYEIIPTLAILGLFFSSVMGIIFFIYLFLKNRTIITFLKYLVLCVITLAAYYYSLNEGALNCNKVVSWSIDNRDLVRQELENYKLRHGKYPNNLRALSFNGQKPHVRNLLGSVFIYEQTISGYIIEVTGPFLDYYRASNKNEFDMVK